MQRLASLLLCILAALILMNGPALADHHETAPDASSEEAEAHGSEHEEEEKEFGYFILGLGLGGATETRRDNHGEDSHGDETSDESSTTTHGAIAFELYYKAFKTFGVGILVEHLGADLDRNATIVLPIGYHPLDPIRLVAGPGLELDEDAKAEWLLRLGVGYIFRLSERWELTPEVNVDWIEGGKITYLYGVIIGFKL